MPDISPQQRIDPLLSKSGVLNILRWAGGGLLIAILGNYLTRWLDPYINLLPTSALSQINFSWLPPLSIMITALILGFIAYLVVRRTQQDADEKISAKQSVIDNVNLEIKKVKEEIREIQNDALKRIQKAEQEVVLARADSLEAIEVARDGNKQIIREIEHNYEKKNDQLVADCQYLLDQNQQLRSNILDGPGSTYSQWSDFANAAPIRQENLDDARMTAIRNRLQKQIK